MSEFDLQHISREELIRQNRELKEQLSRFEKQLEDSQREEESKGGIPREQVLVRVREQVR